MVMGELSRKVDLAVIGGGPGGYTAAIRAAQLGLEVVLIEKNLIGGCCTNVGCIPSKALIHAANVKYDAEKAGIIGVEASIMLDFAKTQKWKDEVVERLRTGIEMLCKFNKVEIINGSASFQSSHTLAIQTEKGLTSLEFRSAIIATGTKIKELPNLPFDHDRVISSDDVFELKSLPKKLIVLGGGYISVEMACLFAKLGTKVTVVYRGTRLLKNLDPEISEVLAKKMKELGCEILFEADVEKTNGRFALVSVGKEKKQIEFEKLLVTTGRVPDYQGFGLEKTKVKIGEDGRILVDDKMRTNDSDIFAIGDVVAGPELAHKAFKQGKVAAEVIAGQKSAFDNLAVPSIVFSEPEIGTVGMSEEEATKAGHTVKIGKMPFTASGRAKTINKTEGFVKVVADGHGVVRGIHAIGEGVEAIIAEGALAIEMGATLEDLALTIQTHPTISESLPEAAEEALGRAIHLYKGKK